MTTSVVSVTPIVERRPWGSFEQFIQNQLCTVKIITVAPGQALSLQYHLRRDEFWKILAGNPEIVIGERFIRGSVGEEFFVPRMEKHRILALDSLVMVLEIALGDFDEDDIVRLGDSYGRG